MANGLTKVAMSIMSVAIFKTFRKMGLILPIWMLYTPCQYFVVVNLQLNGVHGSKVQIHHYLCSDQCSFGISKDTEDLKMSESDKM